MHELPLLIFTLCLQGSVGVTLWLALGRQYAVDGRVPARGALPAMAGAFVLACVGLLASALHMGYPLNALNALRHIASSWLSREVVFASLYLAALGLGVVLLLGRQSFLHGSETLRIHRQINNDAACGRFGDFALR